MLSFDSAITYLVSIKYSKTPEPQRISRNQQRERSLSSLKRVPSQASIHRPMRISQRQTSQEIEESKLKRKNSNILDDLNTSLHKEKGGDAQGKEREQPISLKELETTLEEASKGNSKDSSKKKKREPKKKISRKISEGKSKLEVKPKPEISLKALLWTIAFPRMLAIALQSYAQEYITDIRFIMTEHVSEHITVNYSHENLTNGWIACTGVSFKVCWK